MDNQELVKLINDYPIILSLIIFALGMATSGIPLAFKLGASRERAKITAESVAYHKNAEHVAQIAYEKERTRADLLESEIARLKETRVIDGFVFFVHDKKPRVPFCPSCYGRGLRTPLVGTQSAWGAASYTCPDRVNCKFSIELDKQQMERMQNMDF